MSVWYVGEVDGWAAWEEDRQLYIARIGDVAWRRVRTGLYRGHRTSGVLEERPHDPGPVERYYRVVVGDARGPRDPWTGERHFPDRAVYARVAEHADGTLVWAGECCGGEEPLPGAYRRRMILRSVPTTETSGRHEMIMPKINLDEIELTPAERRLAERIINPMTGRLLSRKPRIKYTRVKDSRGLWRPIPDYEDGRAAYLWRMVAFVISPVSAHHCMPVVADFDLPEEDYELRQQMALALDALANKICDAVPKEEWHGVRRWARVF